MPKEINVSSNILGIWNPEKEGEKIRGFFEEILEFPGDKFNTKTFLISNGFNDCVAVNGYSVIERAFQKIPRGAFVSITYTGTENSSKNFTYKTFEIKAFELEEKEIKEWREKVNLKVNLKERTDSVNSSQKPAPTGDAAGAGNTDDDLPF